MTERRGSLLDEAKMSSNERRAMLDAIRMSAAMSGKKVKATKLKKTVSPKTKDVESDYYNMARNVRRVVKPVIQAKVSQNTKKSLWLGPAILTDFERHMKDYIDTGSKEHLDKAKKFTLSQFVSDSDRLSPEAAKINRDKRLSTIEDLEKLHTQKKPGLAKRIISKMKGFRNYLKEEVDLTANVEHGTIDVHDHAVRDNINAFLNGVLASCVVTPYVALNKVNKVLANFHIFLPKAPYMEDNHGVHVFPINQFNRVAGMRNDGSVVTKVESPYSLFFEWKRNEKGMFDVFAEIVTEEELSDLLDNSMEDVASSEDDREDKLDEGDRYSKPLEEAVKHLKKK